LKPADHKSAGFFTGAWDIGHACKIFMKNIALAPVFIVLIAIENIVTSVTLV
jgi:hypothetical protein